MSHSSPVFQHGGEDGGVEFQNVPRLRVGAGRDDLIPRGDDTHYRAANDLELQHPTRDHGADGGGSDLHEAGQDHLPGTDILTYLPDMLPGRGSGVDRDAAVVVLDDILHHDDRVAVFGDRIAGVHHGELIRPERHGRGLGSAEAVLRPQRYAVHGAGGIVRRVDPGIDRPGRDAPVGFLHRNGFQMCAEAVLPQLPEVILLRLFQGNVCQIFKAHSRHLTLYKLGSPHLWGALRCPAG